MTGFKPLAYRAGAFRYNARILEALHACKIPLSFQYYPASALKPSFPHGFDAGILPLFKWSNGVMEVPLTVHEYPHPRKIPFRYRAFDLNQLSGGAEQAHATMQQFWNHGPGFNVCVMLLHSWSFLRKNESGHFVWENDSLVRLFMDFLNTLPPDVRVITASELLTKISQKELLPAFEMPIQVAGTETIPLLRLVQAEHPVTVEKRRETTPTPAGVKPASVTLTDEAQPSPQPSEETARTIRSHEEQMPQLRQRIIESYPYPRLEEIHLREARLLPSRYQMLDELPKHGNVCELGVANGDFSAHILRHCKPAKLHLVDSWESERYSSDRQLIQERFADAIAAGLVVVHVGRLIAG